MVHNERENESKAQPGNNLLPKKSAEKMKETSKSKENVEEKKADKSDKSKKRNKSAVWNGEKKETTKSKEKTPSKKSEPEKETKKNKEKKDEKKENNEDEEEEDRGYGPQHAVRVLVPVTICICIVVFIVMTVYLDPSVNLDRMRGAMSPVNVMKEGKQQSSGSNVWRAVVNGLIFLGVIAVMTCILVFLYWMKWYKVLWGFLFLGMTLGFFVHAFWLLLRVFHVYSIPMSLITFAFLDLNMIIMSTLTLFWKGPKRTKQGFMIFFSLTAALTMLTVFPTYTTWIILGFLVLWDIFAVLAPFGPLKKFVELAQERDEKGNGPLAALVYTSGMVYFEELNDMRSAGGKESNEKVDKDEKSKENEGKSEKEKAKKQKSNTNQEKEEEKEKKIDEVEEEPEEKNIQLGLGDFVFYSLLIAKACETGCWTTVFACYLTIISGLLLTLMLLIMYKRALPALPISITFGLIFYFAGEYAMLPFQNTCNKQEMIF